MNSAPLVACRSYVSEVEASIVAAALNDYGIHATVGGALLAGFRVEVPSEVEVLVEPHQVDEARRVIDELRTAAQADVDHDADDTDEYVIAT